MSDSVVSSTGNTRHSSPRITTDARRLATYQRRQRLIVSYFARGLSIGEIAQSERVNESLLRNDLSRLRAEFGASGLELVAKLVAADRLPHSALKNYPVFEARRNALAAEAIRDGSRRKRELSTDEFAGVVPDEHSVVQSQPGKVVEQRRERVFRLYFEEGLLPNEIAALEGVSSAGVKGDLLAVERQFGAWGLPLVERAVARGLLTPLAIEKFKDLERSRKAARGAARMLGVPLVEEVWRLFGEGVPVQEIAKRLDVLKKHVGAVVDRPAIVRENRRQAPDGKLHFAGLTASERSALEAAQRKEQVLQHFGAGFSNAEIASLLDLSVTRVSNILTELKNEAGASDYRTLVSNAVAEQRLPEAALDKYEELDAARRAARGAARMLGTPVVEEAWRLFGQGNAPSRIARVLDKKESHIRAALNRPPIVHAWRFHGLGLEPAEIAARVGLELGQLEALLNPI